MSEPKREELASVIWTTSRNDESTISAAGALLVADAVMALYRQLNEPKFATKATPVSVEATRWKVEEQTHEECEHCALAVERAIKFAESRRLMGGFWTVYTVNFDFPNNQARDVPHHAVVSYVVQPVQEQLAEAWEDGHTKGALPEAWADKNPYVADNINPDANFWYDR